MQALEATARHGDFIVVAGRSVPRVCWNGTVCVCNTLRVHVNDM